MQWHARHDYCIQIFMTPASFVEDTIDEGGIGAGISPGLAWERLPDGLIESVNLNIACCKADRFTEVPCLKIIRLFVALITIRIYLVDELVQCWHSRG